MSIFNEKKMITATTFKKLTFLKINNMYKQNENNKNRKKQNMQIKS